MRMKFKHLHSASIIVCAFGLGWGAGMANAQTTAPNGPTRASAMTISTEVPVVGIDAQREQAFQRKQKRQLAIGWTFMGAGTALAVSAVWLSRSGGDPSIGLKRSLAVIIPGIAMVVAGGGVLIKRRIKKSEHNTSTQLRVTPISISVRRYF